MTMCHENLSLSNSSKSPSQCQDEEDNNNKHQEKKQKEDQEEEILEGKIVLSKQQPPDSGKVISTTSSSMKNNHHKVERKEDEEDNNNNNNDNDGFRTPTSLDHKIPVAKQCPPAPRKSLPKPSMKKRKASSSSSSSQYSNSFSYCRSSYPLDLSKEVELLLFSAKHNKNHFLYDISQHCSNKKVRREDHNTM